MWRKSVDDQTNHEIKDDHHYHRLPSATEHTKIRLIGNAVHREIYLFAPMNISLNLKIEANGFIGRHCKMQV